MSLTKKENETKLTERETQVLTLIARGATSKQIAKKLSISPKTADAHRNNLKTKLRAESIAELVRVAVGMGLVEAKRIEG